MNDTFSFAEGSTPLLVSVPHDGRSLPDDIARRMTRSALDIPDTDWHVAELYDFVTELGASTIVANYSRYVVDLNRAASDASLYERQVATGLCPTQTFAGQDIYEDGLPVADDEKVSRIKSYWRPYHDRIASTLAALRERWGYALLWDAHSIPSEVPRLFDGRLPILNLGTFDDNSCAPAISAAVVDVARCSDFETVSNARFKGGYITRHYGDPGARVHAIQLEIAQRAYMSEETRDFEPRKATLLCGVLNQMIRMFLDAAEQQYS